MLRSIQSGNENCLYTQVREKERESERERGREGRKEGGEY